MLTDDFVKNEKDTILNVYKREEIATELERIDYARRAIRTVEKRLSMAGEHNAPPLSHQEISDLEGTLSLAIIAIECGDIGITCALGDCLDFSSDRPAEKQ